MSIFCAQPAESRPRTQFLGAFAYSRKAPFSFLMYVRPCDRMYQLGSNWTDFREILYWAFYENLSKIGIWLKSDKTALYMKA
jgi:hypothetical protein